MEIDFSDTQDDIHRIFHECEEGNDKDEKADKLDVTPIMVACDKGNVVCLEYMLQKFAAIEKRKEHARLKRARRNKLKTLLGNPLTDVSATNRNSALHHAATVGCSPAIQILQRIQTHILLDGDNHCQEEAEETQDKENEKEANQSPSRTVMLPQAPIFLLLGSTRNNHNDTPLMMATQSTQALEFVETWYTLARNELISIGKRKDDEAKSQLRELLQAKNESGDSCLSLACTHGRTELVKFLVGYQDDESEGEGKGKTQPGSRATRETIVEVTADEVYKCKGSLQRMEQALNSSPKLKKQYQSQCDSTKACLKILQAQLEFLSDRATRELLLEEADDASSQRTDMAAKPKRKKKKKAKKVSAAASSTILNDAAPSESKQEEAKSEVTLKTLPDGKTAVEVKGKQEDSSEASSAVFSDIGATTRSQDASDLLRERFKGISDNEVDSVMSALCLDVKCLLYSDHGMALNLSPAQLDAVQQILEKQLESVNKARAIQTRMHGTTNDASDC